MITNYKIFKESFENDEIIAHKIGDYILSNYSEIPNDIDNVIMDNILKYKKHIDITLVELVKTYINQELKYRK